MKGIQTIKEEGKMKKVLLTMFLVLMSVVMVSGNADAITGACSNCHTMHNSQGGSDVDAAGPNERLLSASCIACHKGTGQKNGTTNAPVVLHTSDPVTQGASKTLAGGDFYWVATGYGATDSKGHNVVGIAGADAAIGKTPPGFDQTATTGATFNSKTIEVTGGAGWGSEQLTCAGTFGCHGTRDAANFGGLTGAHHGNTTLTATVASNPSTVGGSFRFLAGIKGLEEAGWNWAETASSHNEYYGVNAQANRQYDSGDVYANKDTISFLCAECHGGFHADIANDSSGGTPWRRHPTDIVLPNSTEYASYNPDNTNEYSVEAPVARGAVPSSSSATVTPGATTATGAIVMCLSCHRAHGSPEADLMRFTYNMQANTGNTDNGCFTCHTTKNAD